MEGIFFKPMLTLYGEMFLSEYTLYDLNDELDCASTENVIEIQTTNPDYSGTDDHLPSTKPMKNLIYFSLGYYGGVVCTLAQKASEWVLSLLVHPKLFFILFCQLFDNFLTLFYQHFSISTIPKTCRIVFDSVFIFNSDVPGQRENKISETKSKNTYI